ncbi:MAG: hypothetical protein BWY83_02159 [bacterium ADurb.Bin478]|nr:MAG: hypothetical protein BWY83_02159 [bacterium ADurb.Bin478]
MAAIGTTVILAAFDILLIVILFALPVIQLHLAGQIGFKNTVGVERQHRCLIFPAVTAMQGYFISAAKEIFVREFDKAAAQPLIVVAGAEAEQIIFFFIKVEGQVPARVDAMGAQYDGIKQPRAVEIGQPPLGLLQLKVFPRFHSELAGDDHVPGGPISGKKQLGDHPLSDRYMGGLLGRVVAHLLDGCQRISKTPVFLQQGGACLLPAMKVQRLVQLAVEQRLQD